MSVLIKGMEMPKHCIDCPMKNEEDDCLVQELQHWKDWDSMKAGCPLVDVPVPHGRLIDVENVKSKMLPLSFSVQKWISEVGLANCKTVIEAEDE